MMRICRCCLAASVCGLMLLISGCARFDDEYGAYDGSKGRKSLNGFGALRESLETDEVTISSADGGGAITTRNLHRLSRRVLKHDAIIWIPTSWPPLNAPAATDWMQKWLRQDHRTLVFIVPDSGSTEAYFHQAAQLAPPAQRLEYRRRRAKLINDRMAADQEREDVSVADWFTARALPYSVMLPDRQVAEFGLQAHQAKVATKQPAKKISKKNASNEDADENSGAKNDNRFQPLLTQAARLKGESQSLITLARIQKPSWKESQVIAVSSGGLLTNFAMTDSAGRDLANRIQREIRQASGKKPDEAISVAVFPSDFMPIPVSNAKPGAPRASGMEILTTWPLSLITIHGLFLGVVMCLMLLPSFGRPRRLRYNRVSHFGNHLSAMATLMRRSGGVVFARQRISQYLRQVRGETSGPWVLPVTPTADPTASTTQTSPENQSSSSSSPTTQPLPREPSS